MDVWLKQRESSNSSRIETTKKRRKRDRKTTSYVNSQPLFATKTSDDKSDPSATGLKAETDTFYEDFSLAYKITTPQWKVINSDNLSLQYAVVFKKAQADAIYEELERNTEYFSGDLARVFVFGRWHPIPRKTVAYGDEGLSYNYSGNTFPALPWTSMLNDLKHLVNEVTGQNFNFVLVNRYKNGEDHIGEHRDDERELAKFAPIASLSFGQHRDFVFRHRDSRGKKSKLAIPPVSVTLEHGSLLLMNYPTNSYWYHSLPVRKTALHPRINLTFRVMISTNYK